MTKIGIMSFAHTHAVGYATVLKNTPGVEVMASDPGEHPATEIRGRALADQLGIDYADDYDGLFDWGPDAVVITSENDRHRSDVERATAAGVHILCEKPLATAWDDGLAISDAVKRAGVILMVAFPVRFSAPFERLRAQQRGGMLGDLVAIRGYNNGMLPRERSWFAEPELSGGGALVDHIVHVADMIDALTPARPVHVTATSNRTLYPEQPVETGALALLEYEKGMIAALDSSWSVPQEAPAWGGLRMSVLGTRGAVDIDFFGSAARGVTASGRAVERRYGANFDNRMLEVFITAVRSGRQPEPSAETGLRTLAIVLAAQESARSGRTIDIPDLLPNSSALWS